MTKLSKIREDQRYTKAALSKLSGVHPNTISRWEQGDIASCNVSLKNASAIASVLKVHAEDLLD